MDDTPFASEEPFSNENPFLIPSKLNHNHLTIYGKRTLIVLVAIFLIFLTIFTAFIPILSLSQQSFHCSNVNTAFKCQSNLTPLKLTIIIVVNFILYSLIIVLCFYNLTLKLEIIKDDVKNTITIIRKNYFCCKKKYNLLLENAYFNCYEESRADNDKCFIGIRLDVINTFKNSSEIDLDNANLLITPIKFHYKFENLGGNSEEINIKWKAFLPNNIYKNNIENEIEKYKKKYINEENNQKSVVIYYGPTPEKNKISELFYSFISSIESFKRIDIIYSKNYDKIFIGVVKNDKTYINRLITNINTIDKFAMSVEKNGYSFKVLLKDGNQIEICNFARHGQYFLESFLFLLNGKLDDINKGIINNSNITTNENKI